MRLLMQMAAADGATVTGSDIRTTGHRAELCAGADLAVYSSAIPDDNVEMEYARTHGIRLLSRAQFLGQTARKFSRVIAVAGSHGKTTATAMLGCIFAPWRPSVHLGGECEGIDCVGGKKFFLTEACEYRRNFLHLSPHIAVVLNVELDHTDYYRDLADITDAFASFASSAPTRICNGDDINSAPLLRRGCITFGLGERNDYRARNITYTRHGTLFTLVRGARELGAVSLKVWGEHNVYNALAAAAAASQAGLSFADVQRGLAAFCGVKRRQEKLGTYGGCDVFTDYAHHPHEIESTVACLRAAGYKKIAAVFEPHTYTRTQTLLKGFARALRAADDIVLAEVYAAREKPVAGVSGQLLARALLDKGVAARCYSTYFEVAAAARAFTSRNDALVFMGAGDIDILARAFVAQT